MGTERADLPFVDEIRVLVPAPAGAVWRALAVRLTRPGRGVGVLARVLGTRPRRLAGRPLERGSTIPGFAVVDAVPGRWVRLEGQHRFSRYALVFTLVTSADGTVLKASTRAAFPGRRGAAYRLLVIGSGAHRVLVTRLLRAVGRQAEAQPAGGGQVRA